MPWWAYLLAAWAVGSFPAGWGMGKVLHRAADRGLLPVPDAQVRTGRDPGLDRPLDS